MGYLLTLTAIVGMVSAFRPQKGRKYATVKISSEYQLDVAVTPMGTVSGWSNIVHLSAAERGRWGERLPAVFLHPGKTQLHVCTACDGNRNTCLNTGDLRRGVMTLVTVRVKDGVFSVSFNGNVGASTKCSKPYEPSPGQTAVLYASGPYNTAANVDISKISYRGVNDDLEIRFNKMDMAQNMQQKDYPPSKVLAETLRKETDSVSVTIQEDCRNCLDIADIVNGLPGGPPTHPSRDPKSPFWTEMREVIQRQFDRKANRAPKEFMPLPKIWSSYNIHQVAEAVHDEFPGVHHSALIAQLLSEGAKLDRDMIPAQSGVDFLRGPVALSELNGWSITTVGPTNFGAKWMFGRARPEEVAWKIARGTIGTADGVPQDIVDDIKKMSLRGPKDFTAYEEGSPVHPSWPAMHSAASSGALWISTVMKLTPEQMCEVKKVDYGVSYGRTVAGVHYATDNFAGLNMGQEVVARELPGYLADRFGADPAKVAAKIKTLRFDWATFPRSKCFRGDVPCVSCAQAVPRCEPGCGSCTIIPGSCLACPRAFCVDAQLPPIGVPPITFKGFATKYNVQRQG